MVDRFGLVGRLTAIDLASPGRAHGDVLFLWVVEEAMPTPALQALNLLLGAFGLAYFVYGKKIGALVPLICGVSLMMFPIVIAGLGPLVVVGLLLILLPRFIQI